MVTVTGDKRQLTPEMTTTAVYHRLWATNQLIPYQLWRIFCTAVKAEIDMTIQGRYVLTRNGTAIQKRNKIYSLSV